MSTCREPENAAATAGVFRKSGSETPEERHIRSGYMGNVAPWAQPSNGPRDSGYYVGGGVPHATAMVPTKEANPRPTRSNRSLDIGSFRVTAVRE